MPKNAIQHHEWNTRDPKRIQAFYSRIFDWKFDDRRMPGYTLIDGIGGIFQAPPEMPTGIVNYVNVSDLDAKEKLIREAGGTIYKSKQEVPNMGWFTIFADPDNNTIAMWQPMMKRPARAARAVRKAAKKVAGAARKAVRRKRR
jgi:predicted enzyme related to lactoylglutathione lyase